MVRPVLRTCVGCGKRREQRTLIRIIADPAGDVLVNPQRPRGRGAYLCPSPTCFGRARDRQAFSRAFRRRLPGLEAEALRARFEEELRRRGVMVG